MKILVLMPCDEKSVYLAAGLYKSLPQNIREKTFAIPMFMDYLVQTHLVDNWISSFYYAALSARKIYNATTEDEDLIIIGNVTKDFTFDIVFNMQDAEESLPYTDEFLDHIIKTVGDDSILGSYVENIYAAADSSLSLRNCIASADFLVDYLQTKGVEIACQNLQDYYQKIIVKKTLKEVVGNEFSPNQ